MFNKLFGDSFLVYKAMTVFQVVIVCTQLFLMHNAQWDRLVSLCLEQFHGYWNLFRIVRNWFTGEHFKLLASSGAPSGGREIPNCNFSKTCLFRIDAKESRSIHDHSKAVRICWKRILQNWTRMSHNILVIHWNQGSKLGFSSFPGNSNLIHVHTNVQFCTDKVRNQKSYFFLIFRKCWTRVWFVVEFLGRFSNRFLALWLALDSAISIGREPSINTY